MLRVSNSESYCVWRSRGYLNCLTTGESLHELFKLDGLLSPVSVSQIVDYLCVRSARSWSGLFSFSSEARCHPICRSVSDRLLAVFFPQCGIYTTISCQPRDKLTDISVDCVVSMPYRSVRKKKEHNRKYYACNSEQLKARGISLYEEDPGKTKAATASLHKLQLHKIIMSAQACEGSREGFARIAATIDIRRAFSRCHHTSHTVISIISSYSLALFIQNRQDECGK